MHENALSAFEFACECLRMHVSACERMRVHESAVSVYECMCECMRMQLSLFLCM